MSAFPALAAPPDWTLVWADEFNGPAGSAPDVSKWTYDTGANGWGNHELEDYTESRDNSYLDGNGHLIIEAREPSTGRYTSARLKTLGKYAVEHGRIEARIQLPAGQGMWPAFWMMGADITKIGWPGCGEMDIMENIGREPSINHATVHGPGYSGSVGITRSFTLPDAQRFSSGFHVFAIAWSPQQVQFSVDGQAYHTLTPASLPQGARWVFDQPFFLLLNVAVGGSWPGNPDATTVFPQKMLVDYVRVYQHGPRMHENP